MTGTSDNRPDLPGLTPPGPSLGKPAETPGTPAVPQQTPVTGPAYADSEQPTGGVEYQQLYLAGRRPAWGWSLGGIVTLAIFFLIVNAIVAVVGAIVVLLVTGTDPDALQDEVTALADSSMTTPASLLFVHVVLIMSIPEVWLITRVFHGLKPRWIASIAPRIRWTWLAASFGVSLVTFVVTIFLGALLPASSDGELVSGGANDFDTTALQFLLIIVLLTPFQAVAEEYVFRGYLTQAFGSFTTALWASRVIAVSAPALLFALAHGAQDPAVFVDRLAFGIVAGILVIATGGLEAGIAYHVTNNLIAFGLTLALGDMTTVLDPQGGGWWDVLLSIVKSVLFVALSIFVARKMRVGTQADRIVLDRSVGRV